MADELYSIHRDGYVSGPTPQPRRPTRKARPETAMDARVVSVTDGTGAELAPAMIDDPLAGIGRVGQIEETRYSEPPPSDRQRIYIADLCSERGLAIPDVKTRAEASEAISRLKSMPRFPQGVQIERVIVSSRQPGDDNMSPPMEEGYYALKLDGKLIPTGKYALVNAPTNTVNDISFWSVWVNEAGTIWRLKQVVGPNLENVAHSVILPVLRRIAADPEAAMALYGHEVGQCGACGRRLTNETSRRLGIGPICRSQRGWS